MCIRYSLSMPSGAGDGQALRTVEIRPGDVAPVYVADPGIRPKPMTWGFPPVKERGGPVCNARLETVRDKPLFWESVLTRRCVVPSAGYYEWKRDGEELGRNLLHMAGSSQLFMAGFYNLFEGVPRFVILTTEGPGGRRMPVVLRPEECRVWLNPFSDVDRFWYRGGIPLERVAV